MRAVAYSGYSEPPTVVDAAEPVCPDDGIVVSVVATGVCRSDWHAWMGHDPVPSFPHTPGHEYAGVIAQVGPRVTRLSVGDRLVVPFALGCGECAVCRSGDHQVCPRQLQPGFTSAGSFADLVAVPYADANVVLLPEGVGFIEAASLGCRFATSYRALVARGRLGPGQWLAVHGCGGVGLSAVMIGVALGARVAAVDIDPDALDLARELGAEATVRADDVEPVAALLDVTDGGAHVSLDALGSGPTMRASIGCLRPLGRHVQVGLMVGADSEAAVPMGRILAQELELFGSHGMPARDYPPLLDLVATGALDPRRLVRRVIGLEEAGAALMAMSAPRSGAGITVVDVAGNAHGR